MKAMVVIPVYEPEAGLRQLVRRMKEKGCGLLIVNDGSHRQYDRVFEELMDQAVVLRHEKNRGKGAAIRTALQYIRTYEEDCGVVGIMDGDGQHSPEDMERLFRQAEAEPDRLILGVRSVGKAMPLRSRLGNRLTREVFRALSGAYISDTQSGLRAFSTELLPELLEVPGNRYEYETNVLLHCVERGIPVKEIPIKTIYKEPGNSTSHFHVLRDSVRIYREFFKFAGSSLAGFAIDYLLFGLLVWLGPGGTAWMSVSNVLARVVSASANYYMNTKLVFRRGASAATGVQYLLLAAGILFFNSVLLNFYTRTLYLPVMAAKLLTELTLFLVSFLVQRQWIFRKKRKEPAPGAAGYRSDDLRKACPAGPGPQE